jgi:hypothetical protein
MTEPADSASTIAPSGVIVDHDDAAGRRLLIQAELQATSTLPKFSVGPLYRSVAGVNVSRRRVSAVAARIVDRIGNASELSELFDADAFGPLPAAPLS